VRGAGPGPEHDREFLPGAAEGLSDQQTGEQFHAQLDASIGQIFDASVEKVPPGG
jgi:hypothetical protein